jgi:hypothetical protein
VVNVIRDNLLKVPSQVLGSDKLDINGRCNKIHRKLRCIVRIYSNKHGDNCAVNESTYAITIDVK